MMNNSQNREGADQVLRSIDLDQTSIDFTLRWGYETLHLMRLDAELDEDRCDHYTDSCYEPMEYQVTICDAPELQPAINPDGTMQGPDTYSFCRQHAAESILSFLIRVN